MQWSGAKYMMHGDREESMKRTHRASCEWSWKTSIRCSLVGIHESSGGVERCVRTPQSRTQHMFEHVFQVSCDMPLSATDNDQNCDINLALLLVALRMRTQASGAMSIVTPLQARKGKNTLRPSTHAAWSSGAQLPESSQPEPTEPPSPAGPRTNLSLSVDEHRVWSREGY